MKKPLLLFLFLFITHSVSAIHFKHLGMKDGLSQLSVMSIYQDKLGRMWYGTHEGLSVYDGKQMVTYKPWSGGVVEKNTLELNGNEINVITGDKRGDVFLLSDESLVKYDIEKETFKKIKENHVRALTSYEGNIWCISNDSIFFYDSNENKLKFRMKTGIQATTCMTITQSSIWIGTYDGLYRVDKRSNKVSCVIPTNEIYRLFLSSKQELWVGCRMDGLYRIKQDRLVQKVPCKKDDVSCTSNNQIREFAEDNLGNIWFGTFDGLQMYNPKTNRYSVYRKEYLPGGLTHSSVFSLYKDRQGTIWVGTYYGGVNYFNPQSDIFLHYTDNPNRNDCLNFPFVGRMAEDKDGNLWICADGGGLNFLNRKTHTFKHFVAGEGNALPHNNLKSISYDRKRNCLYIGTYTGGLTRYDIQKGIFHNYLKEFERTKKGPNNIIFQVMFRNDKLIIAARNGLFLMNPDTGEFTKINNGTYFLNFEIDSKGYIWLSVGSSILRINLNNIKETKRLYLGKYGCRFRATKILEMSDGAIYVGSLGSGLFRYDAQKDTFTKYTVDKNQLLSNYCYDITETKQKNLLVTSDKGITLLNPRTNAVRVIRLGIELPISSIVECCGVYACHDNEIFVGGADGMTSFWEKSLSLQHPSGMLYFSDMYVNNKRVYPNDETDILAQSLPFTKEIHLNASQNDLTFNFAVTNYLDLLKNKRYEYKLEGFDEQWIPVIQNSLYYANLNPGKYILKVREKTDKGALQEISLIIIVHAPWYNTFWAWLIYITITAAIVITVWRSWQARRTLAHSLENERIEKERIEELNQAKLRFFTNVSHEFRTPLTLIVSQTDLLLRHTGIVPSVFNGILKIQKNAYQMRTLISELLDFRKMEQQDVVLQVSEHKVEPFLKDIYQSFVGYASQHNVIYRFDNQLSSSNVICWFDSRQMLKVIFNLLSNAFKYTEANGNITLVVYEDEYDVVIQVKDSGSGIEEEEMNKIFDTYYQSANNVNESSTLGTGIGLALSKKIVELHHGELQLHSVVGEGSTFSVKLNKGNQHFGNDKEIKMVLNPEEPMMEEDTLPDNEFIEKLSDPSLSFTEQSTQSRYTILIVEDNEELLDILRTLFEPLYNVLLATNGGEGLEMVIREKPDLIVSDVMMPVMSGTEMCLQIKSNIDLCHIPIVLLTALDSAEQNIEGLQRGADDYIAKPFNAKVLLARCNNLIRSRLLMQNKFAKQTTFDVDLLAANPLDKNFLEKVIKIIEDNLDNMDFDISVLASELAVGRTLLFTKFKALTGMTPNDFILNHKLKRAAVMLRTHSEMQIADVSDRLGFGSPRYFSRCFKNQFNLSPQEYRKQK